MCYTHTQISTPGVTWLLHLVIRFHGGRGGSPLVEQVLGILKGSIPCITRKKVRRWTVMFKAKNMERDCQSELATVTEMGLVLWFTVRQFHKGAELIIPHMQGIQGSSPVKGSQVVEGKAEVDIWGKARISVVQCVLDNACGGFPDSIPSIGK